ncbi:eukaryotic translation initiation factor 1A-like protein [Tanacetum coccineum]
MPKNKGRGKNRRRGTNDAEDEKRELEFKKEGQEYGQVLRMLGNGRCEVLCSDKTTRLSHICGKLAGHDIGRSFLMQEVFPIDSLSNLPAYLTPTNKLTLPVKVRGLPPRTKKPGTLKKVYEGLEAPRE